MKSKKNRFTKGIILLFIIMVVLTFAGCSVDDPLIKILSKNSNMEITIISNKSCNVEVTAEISDNDEVVTVSRIFYLEKDTKYVLTIDDFVKDDYFSKNAVIINHSVKYSPPNYLIGAAVAFITVLALTLGTMAIITFNRGLRRIKHNRENNSH